MQEKWKEAFCRQLGDNSGHTAFFSQLSLTPGYFSGFSWEKETQLCFSYSTFCQMIQRPGNSRETGALPFPWLWSVKRMPCLFQHKVYLVIATYSLLIIRKQLKSNEIVRTFPLFHLVFFPLFQMVIRHEKRQGVLLASPTQYCRTDSILPPAP